MPFQRPTLQELIDRAAADVESRLQGADAHLRRSVVRGLAIVHAGAMHGAYGHQAYLAKQILPDSAEGVYLARHSRFWGVLQKQATLASGNVIFTGSNGTLIEAGTVLQRSDGAQYTTDADVTIVGGVATAAVSASEAGADGDCLAATKLTLASPIAGVNSEATVDTGGITGGTDDEDEDSLHERLRNRVQYGVPNGRVGDYATWAREVSGVTRAWDYPLYLGGGTVGITFVLDDQVGSIIPDAAKVAEVQAYLEDRAPVDCTPTVFAPVAVPLDFTVSLTPDTAAVRAAVEAELEDLILRKAAPGGTIYISQINEAISLAEGETDHSLTAPAADVAHGFGEIAVMGAITWA